MTRWAHEVQRALRAAGYPEEQLAAATAASLALIHVESGGNPTAQHGKTGAYGLTQQIKRWHPQHVGNASAHLDHYAGIIVKYGPKTGWHMPSQLLTWGSGPAALREYIASGDVTSHDKFFRHASNIRSMTGGKLWDAYSRFVYAWAEAGQPTERGTAEDGTSYTFASPLDSSDKPPLYSLWTGDVHLDGKTRKVGGQPGPGGVTGILLKAGWTAREMWIAVAVAAVLLLGGGALLAARTK